MTPHNLPTWPGWRRVGDTFEKRAKWMLNFGAIKELGELSRGHKQNLRMEIQAFITLSESQPKLSKVLMSWPMHPSNAVSEALAREAHSWLRAGLSKFAKGEPWLLEQPAVAYEFSTFRGAVGYRLAKSGSKTASELEMFKLGVCEVLRDSLSRIRFCAETKCHRPFIAEHRGTVYCSPRCSQATRMRRWRAAQALQSVTQAR